MLQFEWSDEYAVDYGQIDEQHRSLIEMANQVFALAKTDVTRERIAELVKGLYRYMETHFAHEEGLMRRIGYPHLKEHQQLHAQILKQMTVSLRNVPTLEEYVVKLQHLMADWVIRHIADEDCRITDCLPQRVQEPAAGL